MKRVQVPLMEKPAAQDIRDSGAVAIGAMTPAFPPVKSDPAETKDCKKLRIGAMTPFFAKS